MIGLRESGIGALGKIWFLFIFALAFISPGAMAQSAVDTQRTIRVVMDNNYAPYVFQSDEGELRGILIDQWQAWEKKTGIKAEIHAMDWSEALRRMQVGEFDVIDCIVETADRQDYFDFTPPYNKIEASIYFHKDISGISDVASLKGFPVGVKAGDQHIDKLKAGGVTNMILFHNNHAIIEAAKKNTINIFLVDDPSALYLLNKMGIESEFRHTEPIFRDELRRAVGKRDTATLKIVSDGFAAIEPGKLKQIDEKWFGRTINNHGHYPHYLTYAVYAVAVAILLIAGLAVWNRTLRKRILQRTAALSGSEQRFHQIAGNIHEVFWLIDIAKQKMLYISPAYETIWGRSCESLYQDLRSFIDTIHPEEKARVVELIEGDREQNEIEYRIVRPDGSIRWIWGRAFPIKDESGRIYRVAGIAEDITERRSAEEELKKEKEILAKIFNNIPVMIGFVGDDGGVKFVNPEWERTIGWTLKELQEQNVDIFAEAYPNLSYRQEVLDFVAASTGEWVDLKIKVRAGRVIDAACAIVHLSDGTKVAIAQDITGRKQAEDALRRSEDRIRLIIDTIPIMAWTFRPDGRVDFANQRWLDYAGEGAFEDPNRIVHPGDLPGVMEKWLVNKAAGKAFDNEIRLRRADGEYRWFLVRTAPLRDEQGNPIKWYGVSIDIEDSKRAENKLRLAYLRLSYHVENTPLAVIEFDKDLFIKRWSKRAEEIFGWKESEALGKNVYDPDFPIIYKEDISEVDKINEQLMKGIVNSNLSLNRNYTKDGNIVYSEWYNSVLKDEHGKVITILSLVHNVTERKKAEEQQEFEQRDKEALINTTDDMIWSVSRDLRLIAVNKAYIRGIETLTGITVKPGDEVLMQDVVPPDIVAFWKEAYNRALSGESFKKDTFIPTFNKSAESWRETSFNPIYKDATVVAVACHSRDITERKKAEETLQQSYEEIRRLTEHLQKIREEERIAIAREIHDELGQQLTVLKMEMKGLNKKLHDTNEGTKQKFRDILDLLDATVKSVRRISSELRPSLLYNLGLVAAMDWHLKELEKRSGIKTIFNEPKEELELPDSIKKGLFRIFQESLTNVTRHANANKIIVTLEQTCEQLILSIEDNGQGFEKGNIAAKETLGILGMKERSQTMGGNYEIISIPGKGTTVIVAVLYNGKNNLI
jgi:PAS domain S-box-containing protein